MSTQSSALLVGTVVVLVNHRRTCRPWLNGTFGVDQTENLAPHVHSIRPHLWPDAVCSTTKPRWSALMSFFGCFGAGAGRVQLTGPGLGRPLVDAIHGSSLTNLTELRPGTVRILVAFDPWRTSILLVAGDKADRAGQDLRNIAIWTSRQSRRPIEWPVDKGTKVQFREATTQHQLDPTIPTAGVEVAGLRDLFAMKLKVIADRGELRDVLFVTYHGTRVSLRELLSVEFLRFVDAARLRPLVVDRGRDEQRTGNVWPPWEPLHWLGRGDGQGIRQPCQ